MADHHEADRIRAHAQHLLRDGTIGGTLVVSSGHIETPIPVQAPDGGLHSWFVPITIGNQLVGFFQFLSDGTYMRFSSFQRRTGELVGCPAAKDWLDLDQIRARAEVERRPDETSSTPFLTYDKSPDRLVWAVHLTDARGAVRSVFVAGQTVYLPLPKGTYDS